MLFWVNCCQQLPTKGPLCKNILYRALLLSRSALLFHSHSPLNLIRLHRSICIYNFPFQFYNIIFQVTFSSCKILEVIRHSVFYSCPFLSNRIIFLCLGKVFDKYILNCYQYLIIRSIFCLIPCIANEYPYNPCPCLLRITWKKLVTGYFRLHQWVQPG